MDKNSFLDRFYKIQQPSMTRLRQTLFFKIFVSSYSLVLLSVCNPYCYFSVLLQPLRVTLFLDIPDRDEDIFVKTCEESCSHETCYQYQEESRRDGDRKNKLSFKIKLDTTISAIAEFILPSGSVLMECPSLIVQPLSLYQTIFHPPNPDFLT